MHVEDQSGESSNEHSRLLPDSQDNEAYYNKHLLRPRRRRSYGSINSYLTDGGWAIAENDDRDSFIENAMAGEASASRPLEGEEPPELPRSWFGARRGKRMKKRM